MNRTMKVCLCAIRFAVLFIIVSFLLSLIIGDKATDFDLLEKSISGLTAGILIELLKIYERKKFKNQ